jgi:hypothetical protein
VFLGTLPTSCLWWAAYDSLELKLKLEENRVIVGANGVEPLFLQEKVFIDGTRIVLGSSMHVEPERRLVCSNGDFWLECR